MYFCYIWYCRFGIDVFQPEDKCFTTFPSDTLNIPAIVTDRNTLVSSFGMERVFYTYAPNQGERGKNAYESLMATPHTFIYHILIDTSLVNQLYTFYSPPYF